MTILVLCSYDSDHFSVGAAGRRGSFRVFECKGSHGKEAATLHQTLVQPEKQQCTEDRAVVKLHYALQIGNSTFCLIQDSANEMTV